MQILTEVPFAVDDRQTKAPLCRHFAVVVCVLVKSLLTFGVCVVNVVGGPVAVGAPPPFSLQKVLRQTGPFGAAVRRWPAHSAVPASSRSVAELRSKFPFHL